MNQATEISVMQQPSRGAWTVDQLMVHTCDIYRRAPITAQAVGDVEAADVVYAVTLGGDPDYVGVRCFLEPTPEFDEPKLEGVSKQVNVMTSDKWHLPISQPIETGWLIVMKAVYPDGRQHVLFGSCWQVQGNSTDDDMPNPELNAKWVYAKLAPNLTIPS